MFENTLLGDTPTCPTMRIPFLCEQIAGDMLCADQNFDIAQVIRFFRSKVRFASTQVNHIHTVIVVDMKPCSLMCAQDMCH